jgi:hypothetical protein
VRFDPEGVRVGRCGHSLFVAIDIDVHRGAGGDRPDLIGIETLACEEIIDAYRRVEGGEAVIRHDDNIAQEPTIELLARSLDDALHGLIDDLIGTTQVIAVTADLGPVLIGADRVGVLRIGCLMWVGDQELMARAVRLLDVGHDQIGGGVLGNGPQGDAGLIIDEGVDLVLVDCLELEVGEAGKSGIQALGDAEVGLRCPKADLIVDVVHVLKHRWVSRDEVRGVAGNADDGQIRI